ncbi:hypothetical protein [Rhizobacter sp. Root404]|uniref:hypothetical protein n=1 Tax=Rhizobacter sp. Root404 TaxID=1736528 RepID=UPI000A7332B9|nr:hypothetical protein [Rhizobacter sp. Root404]
MKDLNFNIYGFAQPQSEAEYSALLEELFRSCEDLSAMVNEMSRQLAANKSRATA